MDAIRTQETRPVLEITTQDARMHITNSKPRVRIRTERPVMRVDKQKPTITVNRQELRRQLNNGLSEDIPAAFVAKAERRAMDLLSNLPGPQQQGQVAESAVALPNAAASTFLEDNQSLSAEAAANTTTQPKASVAEQPKVDWSSNQISIEWSDLVLEINWEDISGPKIEVEPYSIEVRVVDQPVVRFRHNPSSVGSAAGKSVDHSV